MKLNFSHASILFSRLNASLGTIKFKRDILYGVILGLTGIAAIMEILKK